MSALDTATGHIRWTQSAISGVDSLAVAGSTVYLNDGSKVYALDTATGHIRWTQSVFANSDLAVAGRAVYLNDGSKVHALDAATGHVLWTQSVGGTPSQLVAGPAVAGGVVYVGNGDKVCALTSIFRDLGVGGCGCGRLWFSAPGRAWLPGCRAG